MPSKQALDCLPAPFGLAPQELSKDRRFSTDELAQCDCVSEQSRWA